MTPALAAATFGTDDLHAQYRWNAVAPFIEFDAERTLEITGSRLSHDARELKMGPRFDQVVAIDALVSIGAIAGALAPGGRLVLSVPTPRYPQVLGEAAEGRWLEDIRAELEAAGLLVQAHRYYTGTWVSRACRLYGRRVPHAIRALWAPLVRPLLRATELTVQRDDAANLALVAMKV